MRTKNYPEWRSNTPTFGESTFCKRCETSIGRTYKLLFKSARDSIQYSGAFLVAAAVSHYFFAYATTSLLVISGTIFVSRTVDKLLNKIHSHKIKALHTKIATRIHDL